MTTIPHPAPLVAPSPSHIDPTHPDFAGDHPDLTFPAAIPVDAVLVPPDMIDPFADDFTHYPDEAPESPLAIEHDGFAGAESVTVGTLAHFYPDQDAVRSDTLFVEHRIGGEIVEFKPFETVREARRHAALIFGQGGSAEGEKSPLMAATVSALAYWTDNACPEPEPELSLSGQWVMPSYDTPTGGID